MNLKRILQQVYGPEVKKYVRIMKLTWFLILALTLQSNASLWSQTTTMDVDLKNSSLLELFTEIENNSGYRFFYSNDEVDVSRKVTVRVDNKVIGDILTEAFKDLPYSFKELKNRMILIELKDATTKSVQQQISVSGRVSDSSGEPLPGVTVLIKGTTQGTITDFDGNYTISNVSTAGTLVFSFVGMRAQEIAIAGKTEVNLTMVEDAIGIEEVVAVGYGNVKKGNLTGSISNVTSKEILTTTHSSLAQNLQGKVSGLQIRQNTGEPGDFNSMINIRGFGNPLYVIDGIPRDGGNEFQRLNPNDIESISVIKDASAAIYGLRAANGVIIVTTKQGETGKTKFNYSSVFGLQKPTDMPRMASRAEFAEMWNDAYVNVGLAPYYSQEELENQISSPSTNWYDVTMKNSSSQVQHNISASGGNDVVSFFTSFGYTKDGGLLKTGDLSYEKYNFRANMNLFLTKNLKAEINLAGRIDSKDEPSQGFFNIFYGTRTSFPNSPIYANDNSEYLAKQAFLNPVALASSDISGYLETKNKAFQSSAMLTYEVPFIKGLAFKGKAAYDDKLTMGKSLTKKYNLYTYNADNAIPYTPTPFNSPSRIGNSNFDGSTVTLQGYLLYSTVLDSHHNLDATLVYEQQHYSDRNSFLSREYSFYTNDQIDQAGENNQKTGGVEFERASKSYIGRFNYAFKGKYLLEYAFRYDGSYRYHPDKRWGFFPVVSGGWRVSEEKFMQKFSFVSNLKFRGSYGRVGEDAGAPFQYVPGFSTTGGGSYEFIDGEWTTGAAAPAIVNPYLTWFTSSIKDIGIDLGLLNAKLNLEFDVYQRDRKGLLAKRLVSLPNTFGGELPDENLNSDRVRGFDFSVSYNSNIRDFYFGAKMNFNFARSMNKYVERGPYQSSMDKWRNGTGYRWNDVVWGYEYAGQFQNEQEIIYAPVQNGIFGNTRELPGDYIYVDKNEDGIIDGNDVTPQFYNGTPKLFYGLSLNATWKGFDVNAQFQGSGNYTLRFRELYAEVFAFKMNTPAYFYDRWHKEDPYNPNSAWIPGKWPSTRFVDHTGAMYLESSIWRRDASYLRLKSVELGRTFDYRIIRKLGVENIRIFMTAHNVFTICDSFVKPFDPEKIEGAYSTGFTYPLTKSYNAGININF